MPLQGRVPVRIAVLEDDPSLTEMVEIVLAHGGHAPHAFADCRALITRLRQESFDLLLLDWNLPDRSGVEVLAWSREHCDPPPPVIMVTSRSDDSDIVAALEAGADDYVVKPIQPAVLLARVDALLRRTYRTPAEDVTQEDLHGAVFDHRGCTVALGGPPVQLTAKEHGLAVTLFRNLGRPMSRSHLLETVWGRNPDLPTRTLDVHISRIRTRLGLKPENGFRLTPVHSFGYRLERAEG